MPFVREFEWAEDEELGGEGWMLKGAPYGFNVAFGLGVAHDTLEHFPNKYGGIENEMLAFGSIMYLRAEGGYWYNVGSFRSPAESMASDVYKFLVEDQELQIQPRKTRKLEEDSEPELVLADMETEFCKLWESEGYHGDPHERWTLEEGLQAFRKAADWIRTGYRMAVARYPGHPSEWAYLFDQMVREVDKQHSRADYGEILRVSVDLQRTTYSLKRIWARDY